MEIRTLDELRSLEIQVLEMARKTAEQIAQRAERGIRWLKALKFEKAGFHPLDGTPLNLIEQLNQTFTYLVTIEGTRKLLELHQGDCSGFRLNLGTKGGSDIESIEPRVVAAEVFAAVSPDNNDKLAADIRKVQATKASFQYVFFHSPKSAPGRWQAKEPAGSIVQVWSIAIVEE